jgi:hypothetical protein
LIKRQWKDLDAKHKYGYSEGQVYTIQENKWMDEQAMMNFFDEVWGPYTNNSRHGRRDNYLLQDEFSGHFMGSVNNQINKLGTEVGIIPGGYTGSVQVLDKGVSKPLKGYLMEQFEEWMYMNRSRCQSSRAEVAQWVAPAWA